MDSPTPRRVNKKEYREMQKHPYSLEELLGFYQACYAAYRQILYRRPTVIVAPLRGAEPIMKVIKLIASLEQKSGEVPPVVYPRTGEQSVIAGKVVYDKIPSSYVEAMTSSQKKKELTDMLGRVLERENGNRTSRVMLIDEVFSGGSISEHFSLIDKIIQENNWRASVFGVAVATKGVNRGQRYRHLLWEGRIRQYEVPWLFTTDSLKFLFPLTEPKRALLEYLFRKPLNRPGLALSREATEWRHVLLSDIEKIWNSKIFDQRTHRVRRIISGRQTISGLRKLPLKKPR